MHVHGIDHPGSDPFYKNRSGHPVRFCVLKERGFTKHMFYIFKLDRLNHEKINNNGDEGGAKASLSKP